MITLSIIAIFVLFITVYSCAVVSGHISRKEERAAFHRLFPAQAVNK